MGYRRVEIMPEIIFNNFFKKYEDKYERVNNQDKNRNEFEELTKVVEGLPRDAVFVEYRFNPKNSSVLELVFESDRWNEEDNFSYIDLKFESIVLEKSEVEELAGDDE